MHTINSKASHTVAQNRQKYDMLGEMCVDSIIILALPSGKIVTRTQAIDAIITFSLAKNTQKKDNEITF